jgi:hypothetical protein
MMESNDQWGINLAKGALKDVPLKTGVYFNSNLKEYLMCSMSVHYIIQKH